MIEIEIKVQIPEHDIPNIAKTPQVILQTPRTFEQNFLFDTPDRILSSRDQLLRYRIFGDKAWITWKGPVKGENDVRYKIRKEISIEVTPSSTVIELLHHIGFELWFRYEKYRTVYKTPHLVICVDETPIGVFVELEGPKQAIEEFLTQKKWHSLPRITANYYTLFCEAKARGEISGPYMVFSHHSPPSQYDQP